MAHPEVPPSLALKDKRPDQIVDAPSDTVAAALDQAAGPTLHGTIRRPARAVDALYAARVHGKKDAGLPTGTDPSDPAGYYTREDVAYMHDMKTRGALLNVLLIEALAQVHTEAERQAIIAKFDQLLLQLNAVAVGGPNALTAALDQLTAILKK